MDPERARALAAELIERLRRDGNLTDAEVELLKLATSAATPKAAPKAASRAALNLAALNRVLPPGDQLRFCLDFGTAMSKAWATGSTVERTYPLVLGRPASGSDALAVPSSIFISEAGRIFIGAAAERQHAAEIHLGRQRFDNIKRLLSEVEPGTDIHELALDPAMNPTNVRLTKGDLLVLYLGWLTDMALKALPQALAWGGPDLLGEHAQNLRAAVRRFAIPCFEHAVDDAPSKQRADWAEAEMERAVKRAQLVADTLGDEWDSLSAERAKAVLDAARRQNLAKLDHLLAATPSIREPVAAGATRFRDHFAGQDARPRRLMMVVDAGAGTTDFALFQSFHEPGNRNVSFALIAPSVRMSRIAGNRIDAALRPLMLRACKVDPESGSPWSDADFALLKSDLAAQIRTLKQVLFKTGAVEIALKPGASGTLTLREVEADGDYRKLGQSLMERRNEVIGSVLDDSVAAEYKRRNEQLGKPVPVYVLLSGGSAEVPLVRQVASGHAEIRGAAFEFVPIDELPLWIQRLPRGLSEMVAREFLQCAVAIGGSAPHLPRQQADLSAPVVPAPGGRRQLERTPET
jgi:hypothetical protein